MVGPGTATSDSIPAMLSKGEFVMRAAAVSKYGLDKMFAMNALRLRDGGLVRNQIPMRQDMDYAGSAPHERQVVFEEGAIKIETQEIDPRVHAALLGFELAGRVGR